MNITQDKVAELKYEVLINGKTVSQSDGGNLISHLHGHISGNQLIDKLEEALEGQIQGDNLNISISIVGVRDATADELKNGHAVMSADFKDGDSMNITQDKVAQLDYKLTVDGEVIDQSEAGEPLTYLHGHSNIIPGLEKALEGKAAGDSLQVIVQPEDGYGERDEDNVEELDRTDFEDDVEIGATYYAQSEDGSVIPFTVMAINGDTVQVDFNPPLAGMTLNFDVKVLDVRDATAEELDHGHAHTPEMQEH